MKPIGGYFELECENHAPYHDGVYLNSGRNALRFILRAIGCKVLYVPKFTCPVVFNAISAEGVEIVYYDLTPQLMPKESFPKDAVVLYNNYFGCMGQNVQKMLAQYSNLIVDNAQAFYSKQFGRVAFYSPRKFFGLPDGGIVRSANGETLTYCERELQQDVSTSRMSHLLLRIDCGAEAGFADFHKNSTDLAESGTQLMSQLTLRLMGNVNYESIAQKRWANFNYLHEQLASPFPFAFATDDVPMVYPYLTEDSGLRQRLIDNKIFVARYWPGAEEKNHFSDKIIPLPIDQRYNLEDMKRICEVIIK